MNRQHVAGLRIKRGPYYTRLALLRARQGDRRSALIMFANLIAYATDARVGRVARVLQARGILTWRRFV